MAANLFRQFDALLNTLSAHPTIRLTREKLEQPTSDVDAIAVRAGVRLSPPVHSFYSQIGRLELEWSDTGPKSLVKTPSGEVRIVTGEASIHALSTALGLDVAPDYWLGMLGGDVDAAAPRGERFIPFDYAPCDDQSATGLILRDGVLTNEMACWIPKHGPVWGAMTVTLDEYVEDLLSSWGVLSWASSATRGRDVLTNEPELAKRFRALARPRRA